MKSTIFLFFVLATAVFSCQSDSELPIIEGDEPPSSIPRKDIELTTVEGQLTEQANTFAFNLLKTVFADETTKNSEKNILLSPLSATLALSMLNNGAAGTTGEEIRQALGFGNVSSDEINNYAQKMVSAMQALDPRAVFESANAIWIQTGIPVLNSFKHLNQQYYDAEIRNVDFTQPATIKTINDWTSDKTHGKIPEILKGIDPFTHLILSNALYFKGYWTDPFIKELTTDAVFHTSTGSEQHVPTMRKMLTGVYSKLDNCAAVELSFGNGAFSLVVVLPDEGTSLSAVMEQMDSDWWTQVTDFETFSIEGYSQGIYYEVNLEIPRFKIEYERTLNNDLMAMGMKQPFDMETADFSLIAQTPLWVSDVLQKTFAQMDEDGMEAAAITIIPMAGSSGKKFTTIDFKVNRPFLYFLKEKSTGLIFFAGIMNKIS